MLTGFIAGIKVKFRGYIPLWQHGSFLLPVKVKMLISSDKVTDSTHSNMKKMLFALAGPLFFIAASAQSGVEHLAIIPEPAQFTSGPGHFQLTANTMIESSPGAEPVAGMLARKLKTAAGYTLTIKNKTTHSHGAIRLQLATDNTIGDEGYRLNVDPAGILIKANKPAGLFYGMQTLLQLLPKEIESKTVAKKISWTVPAVSVTDYPRFSWRGLMLDVSRHFFNKQQVEAYIDEMVKYKYNLLHLHLTDDQGWRVEIKSLPKLTEVGSLRVDKTGTFGTFSAPAPDEPRTSGVFFTQEDIKEIVQYAKQRFVNILPEIDMPGHSLAAIAAYPELSCTPGNYKVNSGEKLMNWYTGGFSAISDNTLCPANDKVYPFLDKVFTELAQLFPFEYIHMGGDECAKNFWEQSSQVKQLMQRESLKDMHEVQSYFVKKVEKIIESKGKKMIGWDEILEGGLAPNAAVMSWRGMSGGVEAAKMGHEVVMSPTTFAYLDYMQGDAAFEPPVYATLRLKKAYEFEPVPEGVDPKLIKGGQANLWTEQVYNMRHAEYMTWPRGLAIAECLWSPKEKKDWNDFARRTEQQFPRFDEAQVKYAPGIYDPIIECSRTPDSTLRVKLSTEINGLAVYYSFDNSFPDNFYPQYTGELAVPKDAVAMKVITYRNGKPLGRMITVTAADLQKRADKKK
jgi:hexosaminidase